MEVLKTDIRTYCALTDVHIEGHLGIVFLSSSLFNTAKPMGQTWSSARQGSNFDKPPNPPS